MGLARRVVLLGGPRGVDHEKSFVRALSHPPIAGAILPFQLAAKKESWVARLRRSRHRPSGWPDGTWSSSGTMPASLRAVSATSALDDHHQHAVGAGSRRGVHLLLGTFLSDVELSSLRHRASSTHGHVGSATVKLSCVAEAACGRTGTQESAEGRGSAIFPKRQSVCTRLIGVTVVWACRGRTRARRSDSSCPGRPLGSLWSVLKRQYLTVQLTTYTCTKHVSIAILKSPE